MKKVNIAGPRKNYIELAHTFLNRPFAMINKVVSYPTHVDTC